MLGTLIVLKTQIAKYCYSISKKVHPCDIIL